MQKCARLQHTLQELREKHRNARRLHLHRGQLLENLSALFRSVSDSGEREPPVGATSIIDSLLHAQQEEALLYVEKESDADDEDIGISLECSEDTNVYHCVPETSSAKDVEPSSTVESLGRKNTANVEGYKGSTKHRALSSDDLLHGEEQDGSGTDEDNMAETELQIGDRIETESYLLQVTDATSVPKAAIPSPGVCTALTYRITHTGFLSKESCIFSASLVCCST